MDVETDKAAVTIPSPRGGRIAAYRGKVGDIVNVGDVVVVIDDGAATAAVEETVAEKSFAEPDAVETLPVPEAVAPAAIPGVRRPVPAAPATRRLARKLKVDINLVTPSGPGGRVTPEDVHRFAEHGLTVAATPEAAVHVPAKQAVDDTAFAEFAAHASSTIPFLEVEPMPDFSALGPVEIEPLRSIRRKVARKMVTSMTLVPHVAHMDEADVTDLDLFRVRERKRRAGGSGGRLTLLAFVVKAVTAGLRAAPAFNASLDPFKEEIIYKKFYNIGFAADTGRGLVVPVVKGTDTKSIIRIADDIYEKATLARDGKLPAENMRDGTFTITNIGPLGGTALMPTINYPEVAILAMGKVQEKPVVRDGEIVIRKMLPLTLAFDHRIADGADAARFVAELVRQLSDPNLLLLET
jgi:pyruvate dehydrogenase E2 component (dihydrolipoamide acetyltransferase)